MERATLSRRRLGTLTVLAGLLALAAREPARAGGYYGAGAFSHIRGLNLVVPIELLELPIRGSGVAFSCMASQVPINPADYDGVISYEFEIVATSTSAATIQLARTSDSGTVATIGIGTTGTATRFSVQFTPPSSADTYYLRLPVSGTNDPTVYSARILIRQFNASKTKLYFPLASGIYTTVPATVDTSMPIASTGSTSYTTFYATSSQGSATLWKYDPTYLETVPTSGTPWALESIISTSSGTRTASIGLYTSGGTPVTGVESSTNSTAPQYFSFPFGTGLLSGGTSYQARIKMSSGSAGPVTYVYKSALTVKLTNLKRAESYYRVGRYVGGAAGATSTVTHAYQRARVNLSWFSNPTAYFETVGKENFALNVTTASLLRSTIPTDDVGTSGSALSGSSLAYNLNAPILVRSASAVLVNDLDRLYVSHTGNGTDPYWVFADFLVVRASSY
jgi:hypothetical protein